MSDYDLTYDQMDYNDMTTRKAILEIIGKIQDKTSLSIESNKLFIEAFPSPDGGCIMYVNLVDLETFEKGAKSDFRSFDTPLAFALDNINIVTEVSRRLLKDYSHLIVKSSLFLMDGKYRLLIYTYCRMEKKIISTLSEYGQYLGKGAVTAAMTREHATEIILDDAVETIVKYIN